MSFESMMLCNHLILCGPLFFLSLIFPSIRIFSNGSALQIRWSKYQNFSFSISPSNEHLGLIFFRKDWFDLFAVQGIQESSPAPQFKSINSLALSLFCGPTLKPVHDYWRNHRFDYMWASLIAQLVNNPPAMQETTIRFLDWEDPLEKG